MPKLPKKITQIGKILKKIAPRIGAKVVFEPEWGVAGQITFKNGKRCYLRYNALDLNTQAASEIARDKEYAKYFISRLGYPTITGKAFPSERWAREIGSLQSTAAALQYAKKIGWPIVVKPNSLSQGCGVYKVHNKREFLTAFKTVEQMDRMILIEKFTEGKDYRIVVLEGEIISAYERTPLSVVGDGHRTIKSLLLKKQSNYIKTGRDTNICPDDPRIALKLRHQKLNINSVLEKGRRFFLLDNANLSSGGDATDVTPTIHNDYKKLGNRLAADMNLRLAGIDLLIDSDITLPIKVSTKYSVIEINGSPGLDHYAWSGARQKQIVEAMYLKILRAMENK